MTQPDWHPLSGYGFDQSELDRWLWQRVQMLLGLTTSHVAGIQWGVHDGQIGDGIFRVHREPRWTPTADRLNSDLGEIRRVLEQHSTTIDYLGVDVFAWISWLLSRGEEYNGHVDRHGRYRREHSITTLSGHPYEPVVDDMANGLRELLILHFKGGDIAVRKHSPWPAGKRAAAWVSHDVDHAEPSSFPVAVRKIMAAILSRNPADKSRRWQEARDLIRRPPINPYWQMDAFSKGSREAGSPSTFFMLPHTRKIVLEGSRPVRRYNIRRRHIRELVHRLDATGSELGLHVTYNAHEEHNGIHNELRILNEVTSSLEPRGARCHYLRFTVPDTWRHEEAAGLYYDSSLGWNTDWGFRSGSSMPFRPFDRQMERHFDLWELEVNLMDVAVRASDFPAATQSLLASIRSTGGCAGILIHPTPWDGRTTSEHLEIYRRLLAELTANDIWLASPKKIISAMEQYESAVTTSRTCPGPTGQPRSDEVRN